MLLQLIRFPAIDPDAHSKTGLRLLLGNLVRTLDFDSSLAALNASGAWKGESIVRTPQEVQSEREPLL